MILFLDSLFIGCIVACLCTGTIVWIQKCRRDQQRIRTLIMPVVVAEPVHIVDLQNV